MKHWSCSFSESLFSSFNRSKRTKTEWKKKSHHLFFHSPRFSLLKYFFLVRLLFCARFCCEESSNVVYVRAFASTFQQKRTLEGASRFDGKVNSVVLQSEQHILWSDGRKQCQRKTVNWYAFPLRMQRNAFCSKWQFVMAKSGFAMYVCERVQWKLELNGNCCDFSANKHGKYFLLSSHLCCMHAKLTKRQQKWKKKQKKEENGRV